MIKFWSELPAARAKEQVADLATFLWVAIWGSLAWRLFQFLASFSVPNWAYGATLTGPPKRASM